MNQPYIQTEIFHGLVGMETLLKPEYKMKIERPLYNAFIVSIYTYGYLKHEEEKRWVRVYNIMVKTNPIQTGDDITQTINYIWDEIPAKCKKENLVL